MPTVLAINVRLTEGGAAGIARTLVDELPSLGWRAEIAYGYGPGGKTSPAEAEYEALRITPQWTAAVHQVSHSYRGVESSARSHRAWRALSRKIAQSDLVHLHVAHSFYLSVPALLDLIVSHGKPVVWTMHDQWLLTGRCAQPGTCRDWLEGCSPCPDMKAYPPARIDNAARVWQQKRAMLHHLRRSVPTRLVSCAEWLADEARLADLGPISTITNSLDRPFWNSLSDIERTQQSNDSRGVFVCRDLRDKRKVDWPLLQDLSNTRGHILTVIGDNAPGPLPNARTIPAINDRSELARELTTQDYLVFISRVDYFPLTVMEALAAGLEVYALRSPAMREFEHFPQVHSFDSPANLTESLQRRAPNDPRGRNDHARSVFAPHRMAQAYTDLYEELLEENRH